MHELKIFIHTICACTTSEQRDRKRQTPTFSVDTQLSLFISQLIISCSVRCALVGYHTLFPLNIFVCFVVITFCRCRRCCCCCCCFCYYYWCDVSSFLYVSFFFLWLATFFFRSHNQNHTDRHTLHHLPIYTVDMRMYMHCIRIKK